jgi:hypothetical protein
MLLHLEIILDRRCGQGDFRQPLAFLRTVKALACLEHWQARCKGSEQ